MSPIPSVLFVLLASGLVVVASDAGHSKLKHIHLYLHETFAGPNATAGGIVPSPFGPNATFGQVAVYDDELRTGRNRTSPLMARYQGIIVATGQGSSLGHLTVATVLFVAGDYAGSALSVEGPVLGFNGTSERSIVGGNGKFRMARGYSLHKLLGFTSPVTALAELDLYVLTCDPSYM